MSALVSRSAEDPAVVSNDEAASFVIPSLRHGWLMQRILADQAATMVYAMPQGGKTGLIMEAVAAASNLKERMTPVVILRNFTEDGAQFAMRGSEYGAELMLKVKRNPLFRFGRVLHVSSMSVTDIENACPAHTGSSIITLLAVKAQVEKFAQFIRTKYDPQKHGKILLIIDEADQIIPDICGEDAAGGRRPANTKTEKHLRDIVEKAAATVWVSATAVNLAVATKINQVVRLDCNQSANGKVYHSFRDHVYVPVDLNAVAQPRSKAHPYAVATLDTVMRGAKLPVLPIGAQPGAPVQGFLKSGVGMMLVNPGRHCKVHDEFRKVMCARYAGSGAPTVIVHNDRDIKTYEYRKGSWQKREVAACSSNKPEGATIARAIQDCVDERSVDESRHCHIVIIAGAKAGRGISYESSDHSRKLTHQIMLGNAEHGADLIQGIGRLCGLLDAPMQRILIGSNAILNSYHLHSDAQERIFSTIVTEGDDRQVGPTGDIASVTDTQYNVMLQKAPDLLKYGSARMHKRTGPLISLVKSGDANYEAKFNHLETAMNAGPEATVLDVTVELVGRLDPQFLDLIHDIAYRRGPAEPGLPKRHHIEALKAMKATKGRGNRYDELLRAIGIATEKGLAAIRKGMGGDPRFAWPSFVCPAGEWADGAISILFDEFTQVDTRSGTKIGHLRNSSHRKMTKTRSLGSQGGAIDYLLYHAFIIYENESGSAQAPGCQPQEWGERDPHRRIGIALRLVDGLDEGLMRIFPDGSTAEMDGMTAVEVKVFRRQIMRDGGDQPVIRRYIKGEIIASTSERQIVLRKGVGKRAVAFGEKAQVTLDRRPG